MSDADFWDGKVRPLGEPVREGEDTYPLAVLAVCLAAMKAGDIRRRMEHGFHRRYAEAASGLVLVRR